METSLLVGIAASVGTGVSLLPQLIKIYKEKKPAEISYWMLGILLAGLALWIWYGVLKSDYIIVVSNGISALINLNIFYLNAKYKKS